LQPIVRGGRERERGRFPLSSNSFSQFALYNSKSFSPSCFSCFSVFLLALGYLVVANMSRAYHIFVGRLSSRAAENRNAAVIEYPGTFPPLGTVPDSTPSTTLESWGRVPHNGSSSRRDIQPSSSYPPLAEPSKFARRWSRLSVKVVDPSAKKGKKLRTFKVSDASKYF
jgi:hypothetical protein